MIEPTHSWPDRLSDFRIRSRRGAFLSISIVMAFTATIAQAQNWTSLGLQERRVSQILKRESIIYVGTESGVYRRDISSEPGWTLLGLEAYSISRLRSHPDTPETFYAGIRTFETPTESEHSLFKSTDGGSSWFPLVNLPLPFGTGISNSITGLEVRSDNPLVVYAMLFAPVIYRSDNGGIDWTEVFRGGRLVVSLIHLEMAPSNPDVLYAVGIDGIDEAVGMRSVDGGQNWDFSGVGGFPVWADPSNSDIVYWAGLIEQVLYKQTYNPDSVTLLETESLVSELLISKDNSDHLLSGGNQLLTGGMSIVSESFDGGLTWANTPVPGGGIRSMIRDDSIPTDIYVGTTEGVFLLELTLPTNAVPKSNWSDYE